jgi:hypothetical protein
MEVFQRLAKGGYGLEPKLQSILILFPSLRRSQCGEMQLGHRFFRWAHLISVVESPIVDGVVLL